MGLVLRAHDPALDREVAIKIVRARGLSRDRESRARARLLNEARALASVAHPHVVAIYEVGVHHDVVFVAMELVDGVDLERWLRAAPRSVDQVVEVFAAAARGLAAVHAAGLVHRDVKPANIFIGRDGRVRVGDLGIARATTPVPPPAHAVDDPGHEREDVGTTALTAEGVVVGTPAYMAPEQHLGTEVGPAADQYGLCVSLFEALWHRRPFAVDPRRLLAAKRLGPTLPRDGKVPRWLVAIVLRGLAATAADRFASMDALAAALATGRARHRVRLAAAAAAATSVAIAFGFTLLRDPGPCDSDDRSLAGIWDPQTRAAIERAFAASSRAWTASAWNQIGLRLDAYADEWTAKLVTVRHSCQDLTREGVVAFDLPPVDLGQVVVPEGDLYDIASIPAQWSADGAALMFVLGTRIDGDGDGIYDGQGDGLLAMSTATGELFDAVPAAVGQRIFGFAVAPDEAGIVLCMGSAAGQDLVLLDLSGAMPQYRQLTDDGGSCRVAW